MPCAKCEDGQTLKDKLEDEKICSECPKGTFSNDETSHKCTSCSAGHYIQTGLSLTNFETFPSEYNITTFCFTTESFLTDTYCPESDGFMAVYGEGLVAGKRESNESMVYLVMNISVPESTENSMNNSYLIV